MGARQERSIDLSQDPAVVSSAVPLALQAIGAKPGMFRPDVGYFQARLGLSLFSVGEDIVVQVATGARGGTTVVVSSEMAQLVDWGKNKRNLNEFQQALLSALASVPRGASTSLSGTAGSAAAAPQEPAISPVGSAAIGAGPAATTEVGGAITPRKIFVSYRREDSGTIVGRICDRLERDHGAESVFKDVDDIPFGVDFAEYLDREVERCSVLFAVIGPGWLEATADGRRRLEDPNDFVRIEIAAALRRGIPVVPILVGGAGMPATDRLPEEMKALARRNGTAVRPDPDFHADMTRLLSRLGR